VIVECPGCKGRYDVTGRAPGTGARCRCGTTFALPAPDGPSKLACPGCGAAVSSTGDRCEFCRVELRLRVCPRCFGRTFAGDKHCPACGLAAGAPARGQPEEDAAKARPCPRCSRQGARQPMVAHLVGDVLVDECRACRGVWLDGAAVDRLVRERQAGSIDAVRAHLAPRGLAVTATAATTAATRAYLPCPECAGLMNRSNFARCSGVMLDVCREHGTWFDKDELGRVLDFVLGGGLEKSARKELAEVQAEIRRAKSEAQLARSGRAAHEVGSSDASIEVGIGALSLISWLLD
jgi:Zn-finger nucleic acid-binding protein